MERDVAISWQLRGLRDDYGIYVAITGSMWLLRGEGHRDMETFQ